LQKKEDYKKHTYKVLIGKKRYQNDWKITEINYDNVVSIEQGSDYEKIVRTNGKTDYIFDSYDIEDRTF
jgi:hypothetical protein